MKFKFRTEHVTPVEWAGERVGYKYYPVTLTARIVGEPITLKNGLIIQLFQFDPMDWPYVRDGRMAAEGLGLEPADMTMLMAFNEEYPRCQVVAPGYSPGTGGYLGWNMEAPHWLSEDCEANEFHAPTHTFLGNKKTG